MTHFSDPLYLGGAPTLISSNKNGGLGVGPCGGIYTYDIIPATLGAALVAALQTTAGAANLVLTAGAGTTTVVRSDGVSVIQLDFPRNVTLTSTGNISAVTFTVTGWDVYGQPMTEDIVGPNNSTVSGNKAFFQIATIAASAAVGTNTSAGFGDKLGLPFAVPNAGYVNQVGWAGALARDAGTFVAAVTTSPATSTTGDVRGTYVPSSASNGARQLVFTISFPANVINQSATRALALGVTQA